MKPALFIVLISLSSCLAKTKAHAYSIEGMYVLKFQNEYYYTTDTIVINGYNHEAGTYLIEQHTGYHPVREGKVLPKQFKQTSEIGHYDESTAQLMGQKTGRIYSFPATDDELMFGTSVYKKLY